MSLTASWPALDYDALAPTLDHLHRLAQIGGKHTVDTPFEPNWGNAPLNITPRGFATPTVQSGDSPSWSTTTCSTTGWSLSRAPGGGPSSSVQAVSPTSLALHRGVLSTPRTCAQQPVRARGHRRPDARHRRRAAPLRPRGRCGHRRGAALRLERAQPLPGTVSRPPPSRRADVGRL